MLIWRRMTELGGGEVNAVVKIPPPATTRCALGTSLWEETKAEPPVLTKAETAADPLSSP